MVMWCSSLRIREVSRGWQQLGEFMPTTVSRNHRAEITSSRDEGETNNGGHLRLVNTAAYCITYHFLQLLDRIAPRNDGVAQGVSSYPPSADSSTAKIISASLMVN